MGDWQNLSELIATDELPASRAAQAKKHFSQHARDLSKLAMGQHVQVLDPISRRWDKVPIVMSGAYSRKYEVRLPSGSVLRRNRVFISPVPDPSQDIAPHFPVAP